MGTEPGHSSLPYLLLKACLQIKSQNVTLDCKNVEPFGRANKFAFVKLQTGLCNCSDKKRRAWPLLVEEHVDRTSRHIFWEDNSLSKGVGLSGVAANSLRGDRTHESHSLADGNAGITDGA